MMAMASPQSTWASWAGSKLREEAARARLAPAERSEIAAQASRAALVAFGTQDFVELGSGVALLGRLLLALSQQLGDARLEGAELGRGVGGRCGSRSLGRLRPAPCRRSCASSAARGRFGGRSSCQRNRHVGWFRSVPPITSPAPTLFRAAIAARTVAECRFGGPHFRDLFSGVVAPVYPIKNSVSGRYRIQYPPARPRLSRYSVESQAPFGNHFSAVVCRAGLTSLPRRSRPRQAPPAGSGGAARSCCCRGRP